jgi:hypothetical protein
MNAIVLKSALHLYRIFLFYLACALIGALGSIVYQLAVGVPPIGILLGVIIGVLTARYVYSIKRRLEDETVLKEVTTQLPRELSLEERQLFRELLEKNLVTAQEKTTFISALKNQWTHRSNTGR